MNRMLVAVGLVAMASCGDDPAPNGAPFVQALSFTTAEDTPLTINVVVSDPDRDLVTVSLSAPGHGTLTGSNRTYVYTPAPDFQGTDSVVATASDGALTATATLTITVTPVNDGPVAGADAFATAEDTALTTAMATLLRNDTDPEGDVLTVTGVGSVRNGAAAIVGSTVVFTPTVDFAGDAGYQYTVADGGGLSATGVVTIAVGAGNDPPVAVDDAATTAEDVPLVLAVGDLLGNDTDGEGQTLAITSVGAAVGGTISQQGETLTFVPAADSHGPARFDYAVSDGSASDTGTVVVTITPVNDPPVAGADVATTAEDTAVTIAAGSLLINDDDVDGDALVVTAVGGAMNGAVVLTEGQVRFTPAPDVSGAASFTYTVSDGTASVDGAVAVTVTSVNDAPVATDDAATTAEDTALELAVGDLVGNDVDVDGDVLAVVAVGDAVGGTVSRTADTVRFVPAPDTTGAASFSYTVSDGTASDQATVAITVTAVNDPPTAVADSATTTEDTPLAIAVAALLDNDLDRDGGPLTVTAVGAPEHGTVVLAGATVTFTPAANFAGAASFTYTVSDGIATDVATVSVTITPVNDPPVAVADTVAGSEDTPRSIDVATLLDNDSDVDGDTLTVTAVGGAVGGSVALAGDTVTFTPAADREVPGSFTYTVRDGAVTDTGAVTVTLAAVNDAPVAVADAATTAEDTPLVIAAATLLGNDRDVEDDDLTVTAVADPTGGTVSLAAGTITFTPALDYSGAASFTYTVSDGALTATATVAVTVTAVNDPPVALARQASTMAELPVSITLMASDADADTLSFEIVTPPGHGALTGSGATRTYTPAAGFVGTDSFTYLARDIDAASAPATVTIEVHAVTLCGDGDRGDGEACDDGNRADQDGCSRACAVEACGDGAVQLALGEQCDDDNPADGDGCSAACQLEGGFTTTAPLLVSGGLACGLDSSHTGRKVAIDGVGTLYAVLRCDGAAHVVVSTDRGQSFSAPAPVGLAGVAEMAIAAGAGGVAYVAARVGGEVHLVRSEDAGQTWSAAEAIATSVDSELSVEAWADDVYVGVGKSGAVEVLRSDARGASWQRTTVTIAQVFFDLLLDDRSGDLLVCTDSPGFHVRRSRDQGATFAVEQNPAGSQSFSDWTAGNGQVLVAGSGTSVIRLGSDDLALATPIAGLPQAASSQRAISADAEGNSYLVGRAIDGTIQLRRLLAGSISIDGDRELAPAGTHPGIASLPTSDGAAIVFAVGTEVYATVQVYD